MASLVLRIFVVSLLVLTAGSIDLVIHRLLGKHVSCYPVVCRVGFQASFCKRNRTSDYCHLCPYGSRQDRAVDSRSLYATEDIPKCSRVEIACLMSETTPVVENGKVVRCECDLSNGYVGEDPLCIKVNSCPPERELANTSGRCIPCPSGSCKNTTGYEFCKPWTSCETHGRETLKVGNSTADTVCGKRLQTTKSEPSLYPTANTFALTLKCETGDCLTKAEQTVSKEVIDNPLQHQDKTDQHHSKAGGELSNLYFLALVTSMILILCMICGFTVIYWKLKGRLVKGFHRSLSSKKEKDIENCLKPGIQEVNEIHKHKEKGTVAEKSILIDDYEQPAAKTSTPIDDEEQPETMYPPINEQPAEPTAPELSMQGNLEPLIHVPSSCYTSDAKNDGLKVNIYVQKGNYG
ncbi:uncharacterized protein LOC110458832 isoform X2 [Mizuhopecten yessoensis]|uniref:uncharacterized protein LOC110458832 isoform X2 n=1 Tax=Mizuhopecten yessoensis TaxID=6573 RepID=UPI000B45F1AC|nr:uncharacterized protein LOC110458832 isoform X2 [Mizuhopecten yessoensis]